jgi:hypothetical protein
MQLTAAWHQPAQENPPQETQLAPESEEANQKDATAESFFCVFGLSQAGQQGGMKPPKRYPACMKPAGHSGRRSRFGEAHHHFKLISAVSTAIFI